MINNFALLNGFTEYLKENNQSETLGIEEFNSVSIFTHSNEFKEYLINELGANLSITSKSIDEILNMEFANGQIIDNNTDTFEQSEDKTQKEFSIVDILNNVLNDESMKNLFDTDKTGEISKEEFENFLNNIKNLDGNDKNISLNDIVDGMNSLKEGEEEKLSEEEVQEPTTEETKQTANAKKPSSSHSSGGNSGNKIDNVDTQNKSYEEMNNDELESALSKENSTLNSNKDQLEQILNGSDSQLQTLENEMNKAYETYHAELKNVDSEMASELEKITNNLKSEEKNHDTLERDCIEKKSNLTNCETNHINAQNRLSSLKSTKAALESSNSKGTPAEKKNKENNLTKIKEQIKDAEQKVIETEQAKIEAQQALNEAETKKVESEKNINAIEEQRTNFENQIAEKYPEIQAYQQAYENAKTEYDNYKNESTSKLKSNIEQTEKKIQEISIAKSNNSNSKESLAYTMLASYDEEMGKKLAAEAIRVANTSGDSVGCGRAVRYTLENLGYEGIQRCKGKEWAETNLANRDDFVEITDQISLDDIKNGNVPLGSVVCFSEYNSFGYGSGDSGHVAIVVDYNGKICEASGYIRKAGINTNIIELGQGSYRIFMPSK